MATKLGDAGYSTGGSVCALCGGFIPVGTIHACSFVPQVTYNLMRPVDPTLVQALERIASALEKIADRILNE